MSVRLMARVWELELPHAQMLVALALADHGDDDGSSIYPSQGRIAWKTGYTERQVRAILRRLECAGLITKVAAHRGGRGTEFRMDVRAVPSKADYDPNAERTSGRKELPGRKSAAEQPGNSLPIAPEATSDKPSEPSCEPSLEVEAPPRPPEVRPRAALERAFAYWAEKCRRGSRVELTETRAKAYLSRRKRDGFTIDQLLGVIDGAAAALAREEFDHPDRDTEFGRLFVDREHVEAWLVYERTDDPYVLQEMLLTEEPKGDALPVAPADLFPESPRAHPGHPVVHRNPRVPGL